MIQAIGRFAMFWYDFVIGDDATVAVGVIVALGVTAWLSHADITAWWVLPVVTAVLLAASLVRAARHARREH
jgi:phosphate/sulfate permease